ncbi:hypothetical protein ACO0OE_001391 [Hanseniaspora uvarum]
MAPNWNVNKVNKAKKYGKILNISHLPELKEKFNTDEIPITDAGEIIPLKDDEFELPVDPEGELKVDLNGNLKNSKTYKFKTFTIDTRPNKDKLYVLAADVAKVFDYKRAAVLFLNHKLTLYKSYLTEDEKKYLLDNSTVLDNVTPMNLTKSILVITAKSLFKEFGHKTINNGKPIEDDYYNTVFPYEKSELDVTSKPLSEIYQYLKPYMDDQEADVPLPPKPSQVESIKPKFSTTVVNKVNERPEEEIIAQKENVLYQSVLNRENKDIDLSALLANNGKDGKYINIETTAKNIENINDEDVISALPPTWKKVYKSDMLTKKKSSILQEDKSRRILDLFNMMQSNLNISLNADMNQENWIYLHADACSKSNYDMYENRERWQFILNRGVRDVYTNVLHVPKFTQPTKVISKTFKNGKENKYSIGLQDNDVYKVKTGLQDLQGLEDMVNLIDDDEIKDAIKAQVDYEVNN